MRVRNDYGTDSALENEGSLHKKKKDAKLFKIVFSLWFLAMHGIFHSICF